MISSLAYTEMRLILANVLYHFDMELDPDSENWIQRQRNFNVWDRIPLNVHLSPVRGQQNGFR